MGPRTVIETLINFILIAFGTFLVSAHNLGEEKAFYPRHSTIWQFPVGTWIENIAVRPNGNLLVTSRTPNASLYEIDIVTNDSVSATPLFTIDTVSNLAGITELENDVFAIAGGNITSPGGVQETSSIWTVNFTDSGFPEPKLRASLREAKFLNGMIKAPGTNDTVLVADSLLGLVWRVNLDTGRYEVAFKVPEMSSGSADQTAIGINGIRHHKKHLWWTNSAESTIYRIKLNKRGNRARGSLVQKVKSFPASSLDDFAFGPKDGDIIWVVTNSDNRMFALLVSDIKALDGPVAEVVNPASPWIIPSGTACSFGRTEEDTMMLYITTGGITVNGTSEGGKIEGLTWLR